MLTIKRGHLRYWVHPGPGPKPGLGTQLLEGCPMAACNNPQPFILCWCDCDSYFGLCRWYRKSPEHREYGGTKAVPQGFWRELPVLISWSCHNKLLQTWWLKTIEIYSHSYGGQKSEIKMLAGLVSSRNSEGEPVLCLSPNFWWWPAVLNIPRYTFFVI